MNEVLRQQLIREIVTAGFEPENFNRLVALHTVLSEGCAESLNWFDLLAAARKQPQLFYQSPDTLNGKLPYVKAIAEALGQPLTTSQLLAKFPSALTYAANHLHLRYTLAKTGHATALTSVITMPSAKAETIAVTHYQSQIARTGTGRRTLQVMHAKGLIKSLPPGIDPIARPSPWRERCP